MKPKAQASSTLIPQKWEVPEPFRQRLGQSVGRQRIMEAEGHLLVILHEPPEADETHRDGRIYWRDADGVWMPKGMRHGEHAIGELLAEYEQTIDKLDYREEVAESADDYFALLRDLNPVVRAANNLYTTLQKAREAMPDDRQLILLRDAAYSMSRRVELLAADTRHGLDYHIALRAEQQADNSERMAVASYRLNLLVAFFFPIATIAGIFGMNLHNPLEELSERTGALSLVGVLAFGLVMGVVLIGYVVTPPRKRERKRG